MRCPSIYFDFAGIAFQNKLPSEFSRATINIFFPSLNTLMKRLRKPSSYAVSQISLGSVNVGIIQLINFSLC